MTELTHKMVACWWAFEHFHKESEGWHIEKRKKREKKLLPHAEKKNTTSTNCTTTGWRSPADIQRRVSVFREAWGSAPFTAREPDL